MKSLFLLCLLGTICFTHATRKPNFIIIFIDDMGYGDIGPFGSDHPTPHLDRMAKEGMKRLPVPPAPIVVLRRPYWNGKERGLPGRQAGRTRRKSPSPKFEKSGLCHRLLRQVAFGRSTGLHAAGSRIRRIRGHSLFQRHVGQRKPETKAPALDQGKQSRGPYFHEGSRCHNGCRATSSTKTRTSPYSHFRRTWSPLHERHRRLWRPRSIAHRFECLNAIDPDRSFHQ